MPIVRQLPRSSPESTHVFSVEKETQKEREREGEREKEERKKVCSHHTLLVSEHNCHSIGVHQHNDTYHSHLFGSVAFWTEAQLLWSWLIIRLLQKHILWFLFLHILLNSFTPEHKKQLVWRGKNVNESRKKSPYFISCMANFLWKHISVTLVTLLCNCWLLKGRLKTSRVLWNHNILCSRDRHLGAIRYASA